MKTALQFEPRDWERLQADWRRWWAAELDRPLVIIENPVRGRQAVELTHAFLAEDPIARLLDYYQGRLERTALYGDAWPKWFPFFGAGVMAAFLGAELNCAPETGTIWFDPPANAQSQLELDIAPGNFWWERIFGLTQAAVERWGERVCVGITDLGGNLDILASLRGSQSLLYDFHDQPDQLQVQSQALTRLWLDCFEKLYTLTAQTRRGCSPWAPIWAPGKSYMLQSDLSAMISPRMFERFVLPDLQNCCNALDYSFYHMDGAGQIPHLELLLSIDNLHGIQWIPGAGQPEPQGWLSLLGRIRQGGKLCQVFVSAEGAIQITRNLGGKGFAFYILDPLSPEDAEGLLTELTAPG